MFNIRITIITIILNAGAICSVADGQAKQYVNKEHGFVLDVPNSAWKVTSPNFIMGNAVGCVALREFGSTKGMGSGVIFHIHKCRDPWAQFRHLKVAENGVTDLNGTPFYWFKTRAPKKGAQVVQYYLPCDDATWLFDIRAQPATLKDKQKDIDQILRSFSFDLPSIEPVKPLAHFRFNNDAKDISNADSKPIIRNAQYRDNSLYLDGSQRPGRDGSGTSFYLRTPSLDYHRFTLQVRFKAETFEGKHSAIISGGPRTRWFHLSRAKDGKLQLGLENHKFRHQFAGTEIKAGQWYDLVCSFNRYAGYVQIKLNEIELEPVGIPMGRGFFAESQDYREEEKMWTFANLASGSTFKGLIDELAIFDRAILKRRAPLKESDVASTPSKVRNEPKTDSEKPSGVAFFLISKGKPISGVTSEQPMKTKSSRKLYVYKKPVFEITPDRIEKYTASSATITLTPKARRELATSMKTPTAKSAGWFVMMQNGNAFNGEYTTNFFSSGPQKIQLLGRMSVRKKSAR